METKFHTVTITVYDREFAYNSVSRILHDYSDKIRLRVGHPIREVNAAVIFIILKMSTDALGAFTGKLGQIEKVKVKAATLKI